MSSRGERRRPPRLRGAKAGGTSAPPPQARGRTVSLARAAGAVLRCELRGLLRDRRALFFSVLLPVALYPLLFVLNQRLEGISRERMEARSVGVALALDDLPEEMEQRLRELLAEHAPIELRAADERRVRVLEAALERGTSDAEQQEREELEQLAEEGAEALLLARHKPDAPGRYLIRVWYDGARDLSNEAQGRVSQALDALTRELRAARLEELLGGDPARRVELEAIDVASALDAGGAALGRLVPLLAVLVLLSGASFAALSAFAGEREAGTLETLLVQPVQARALALGKLGAVLALSLAALVLNAASVAGCALAGLGALPAGALGGTTPALDPARLALSAFVFLPACVLLCAALCLACSRAHSFREGQHYLLPLGLLALLPTLAATRPEVELDPVLACIPLAGPSLAFRDALAGSLRPTPALLALLSGWLWAGLVLARLVARFSGERLLDDARPSGEAELAGRRALRYGWAGVFVVYLAGGLLQTLHPVWGLLATLWILLPALAIALARHGRERGEPMHAALGLLRPSPLHALGALLAAPGLASLARSAFEWQQKVLPLPSSMSSESALPFELASLSPAALLFVMALTPGVCEELFFRGAVLGGTRRELAPWKSVAWQALLFGAVHASIYRFAPTAMLGALLALLTLRARSVLPAMILHFSYNACLVLATAEVGGELAQPLTDSKILGPVALIGLALFATRAPQVRGERSM